MWNFISTATASFLSSTNRLDFHEYFFTSVDITGVKILTIELNMSNDFYNCDSSGWFEPTLYRELDRGEMNITSPQIYPDLTIASYGLDIRGNSRSAGNLSVCLNGNETDTAVSKTVSVMFPLRQADLRAEETYGNKIPRAVKRKRTSIPPSLSAPSGEIHKSLTSFSSWPVPMLRRHITATKTTWARCFRWQADGFSQTRESAVFPRWAAIWTPISTFRPLTIPTSAQLSAATISAMWKPREILCFYADGRQVATSRENGSGDVQIITADIPANASTLTLRAMTTEGISANAADWIEPILCKSEASLSKNSRSEFASGSAQNVSAKYNFAARFSAAEKFSEISLATTSSGAKEVAPLQICIFSQPFDSGHPRL